MRNQLQDDTLDCDFESIMAGMNAQVHIDLGWTRFEISQTFINTCTTPIEANYTFPIPSGAQLVFLTATLADKTYRGSIQPKRQAQVNYDEAVTAGDSAIMINDLANGLLNCRFGNLLAGESATISYVYLQPTQIANQRIRLTLPTTIAPKYGNAHDSGMLPLDYPVHAAIAGYPFQLRVTLSDVLRDVVIESPSHPLKYQVSDQGVALSLAGKQGMDKDFVLLLDLPAVTQTQAWQAPDKQGCSAMVSSIVRTPSPDYRSPVNIKLLVDCSGSMEGEAIFKTKEALLAIMDQLDAKDSFSITRFGSHFEHFYPDLLPCDRHYKRLGKEFIDRIDANMGGTELYTALEHCLKITDRAQTNITADVLLITDGQVDNEEDIIQLAATVGQRVFVVGISSAVSEHFLLKLAQDSQATAGFIYPQEDVTPVIGRMFERMRGDWVTSHVVKWSAQDVDWQVELPKIIYADDSVVFGARFQQAYEQMSVHVSLTWKSGSLSEVQCQTQAAPEIMKQDMTRLLVSRYLRYQIRDNSEQLAIDYQLLTPETALFMRIERADDAKGSDDPNLVNIANPMPRNLNAYAAMPPFFRRLPAARPVLYSMSYANISYSHKDTYYDRSASSTHNLVSDELFDGQDFDALFCVGSLEEAQKLVRLLEAALMKISTKAYRNKLSKKSRKQDLATLRDDIQSMADDKSYLVWDDDMLDPIYYELRESIEMRIDAALNALLSEMNTILG